MDLHLFALILTFFLSPTTETQIDDFHRYAAGHHANVAGETEGARHTLRDSVCKSKSADQEIVEIVFWSLFFYVIRPVLHQLKLLSAKSFPSIKPIVFLIFVCGFLLSVKQKSVGRRMIFLCLSSGDSIFRNKKVF